MILNSQKDVIGKDYSVFIVGSGPAGISLALALEKKNIKSLIIESGNLYYNEKKNKVLKAVVANSNYPDLSKSRRSQFGGTTSIWGGNCNKLLENDFSKWPFKKNDLDKYEKYASKILNLKGFFFKEDFLKDYNYYNLQWSNVRFGKKYLDKIKKSNFIDILLDTYFINFKLKNQKVEYALCKKNKNEFKIKSKNYVLCCGGIENTRHLLILKKKNKNILDHNLPCGMHYMNHPYFKIGDGVIDYEKFDDLIQKNKILNKPILTCNNNIYLSANKDFIKRKKIFSNSAIYIRFKLIDKNNSIFKQLRCMAPNYFKKIYEKLKVRKIYKLSLYTLQEQRRNKYNRIELSNEKDSNNLPLPKIFWKRTEEDFQSLKSIALNLGQDFLKYDLGRLAFENYVFDKNDFNFKMTVGNHQIGGTVCGTSSKNSVVNKNLKVHGLDNLFVSGSSVFSSGGHAHPTFTIVQLSLRLADYISTI